MKLDLVDALASPLQLGVPNFAATACILIATLLLFRFRDDGSDRQASALAIDGDECQVSGGDVLSLVLNIVLNPHLDPNLHGGAEYAVHRGSQDDERAHANGNEEVDVVHGGRDHVAPRVTMGGHGPGQVDPVHKAATE